MASLKATAAIALTLIVAVPILMGYGFASAEETTTSWESSKSTNVTELLYNSSENYYTTYVGTTNNSMLASGLTPSYVSTGDVVTSYPMRTSTTVSITFPANTYVSMEDYEQWSFYFTSGTCYVNTTHTEEDGSIVGGTNLYNAPDTVTGYSYAEVKFNVETTLDVTVYSDVSVYADVTAGWKLPTAGAYWENDQTNSEVVFNVYVPSGSSASIGAYSFTNTDGYTTVSQTWGGITNSQDLGNYSYIRVVWGMDEIEISGLAEWPEYGSTPTTYNTVTFDRGGNTFTTLYLENTNLDAIFRVDSAQIVAGTYPITENYSLRPYIHFPEQSIIYTIKSVATYGTSFNPVNRDTLQGTVFRVTDGTITVDGEVVKLRGMQIKFLKDSDGKWDVYYNDHLIYENLTNGAYVYMGGIWNLTMSADTVAQTTVSTQAWVPGEFAFEKEDFAACGLLVAGICLVGLGMTGPRSGTKIGVLLMICGGAGLIYLTII